MYLRYFSCKHCRLLFAICQSCYRRQIYCCQSCRIEGQRLLHRQAQKRYRQTVKGREAHRQAERRRRMRKSVKNKKTVDDASSTPTKSHATLPLIEHFLVQQCHFCGCPGVLVYKFARRGYGQNRHPVQIPAREPKIIYLTKTGGNPCRKKFFNRDEFER